MREKLRAQAGNRLYSGKGKFVGRLFAYLHVELRIGSNESTWRSPGVAVTVL